MIINLKLPYYLKSKFNYQIEKYIQPNNNRLLNKSISLYFFSYSQTESDCIYAVLLLKMY